MNNQLSLFLFALLFVLFSNCSEEGIVDDKEQLKFEMVEVVSFTHNSVTIKGSISSYDGPTILFAGAVWDTLPNPIIELETKNLISLTGNNFETKITSLQSGKNYFIRLYATNEIGTSYSEEIEFETKSLIGYSFDISIISGFLDGEIYSGDFTFSSDFTDKYIQPNPKFCPPKIDESIEYDTLYVDTFNFIYRGDEYKLEDLDYIPYVVLENNVFRDIHFVGGPMEKRFGLNDGFCRSQFYRAVEAFISQNESYFGYLDKFTFVEGAGTVSYEIITE